MTGTLKAARKVLGQPSTQNIEVDLKNQLVLVRFKICSDSRFDFKNGFYDLENLYFDIYNKLKTLKLTQKISLQRSVLVRVL